MAKLQDYTLKGLPDEIVQFKDDVRQLINFGKYQPQVLSSSTAPTLAGRAGEFVWWRNGTDGRLYVYMGSSWNLVASWTADGSTL